MSDRQLLAQDIAHDLAQAEVAVDAAIVAVSGLLGRLPAYRVEASLSAVSGQTVFAALGQTANQLTLARGELVRGHNGFEALRRAMKLQPVTAGGPADKPDTEIAPTPLPGFATT